MYKVVNLLQQLGCKNYFKFRFLIFITLIKFKNEKDIKY
jgi:hypothetical protein